MQQVALPSANVLVYFCLDGKRGHKAQHSSEGFTLSRWPRCAQPESIKPACPQQLPPHKTHLYHDVHAHPKSVLRDIGPKVEPGIPRELRSTLNANKLSEQTMTSAKESFFSELKFTSHIWLYTVLQTLRLFCFPCTIFRGFLCSRTPSLLPSLRLFCSKVPVKLSLRRWMRWSIKSATRWTGVLMESS